MRHQIGLALITVVLAAGCSPSEGDGAAAEPDEMSSVPNTADREPDPDEAASMEEPADSATPDDVQATDDAAEDATGNVMVSIGDFFFEPDGLSVEAGDTVTWTHEGDITHNVTSRDGSFASENVVSGETFVHTFAETGSFEYRCTLHGQMVGSIDVS